MTPPKERNVWLEGGLKTVANRRSRGGGRRRGRGDGHVGEPSGKIQADTCARPPTRRVTPGEGRCTGAAQAVKRSKVCARLSGPPEMPSPVSRLSWRDWRFPGLRLPLPLDD